LRPAVFGQRSGAVATLVQQEAEIVVRFSNWISAGDERAIEPLGLGQAAGLLMLDGGKKLLLRP
jgi:hypothetical protein